MSKDTGREEEKSIKLFHDKKIRVKWVQEEEKWYFSIVDVVAVLTENDYQTARKYWNKLAQRLREEGNESVTNCHQLKLKSSDGKYYKTDVADTEQLLRLIQSIPSKKAEPFKMWLAKVGRERIDETDDPELSIDRAMKTYLQKGYSEEWINQRLKTIEVRKQLTDEWNRVVGDFRVNHVSLASVKLEAPNMFENCDNERSEYLVKVNWIKALERKDALWKSKSGLYSTQLVKSSLQNQPETIKYLEENLNIELNKMLQNKGNMEVNKR